MKQENWHSCFQIFNPKIPQITYLGLKILCKSGQPNKEQAKKLSEQEPGSRLLWNYNMDKEGVNTTINVMNKGHKSKVGTFLSL